MISGTVFEDENGDGIFGAEFGRPNWVVYLDANNNGVLDAGERSVRSVAGGGYTMTGVAPGTYTLRVQMQPHFHQTLPQNNAGYAVTISGNGSATGKDFGIRSDPTEIRGSIWNDADGDGVRDAGELPLAQRLGDQVLTSGLLIGFVRVRAFRGDFVSAIHLLGAAGAIIQAIHFAVVPNDRAEHDALLEAGRRAIGGARADRALAEGQAMTIAEAVALALAEPSG